MFSLALVLLFGLVRIASGQADQGTITGVVQDASGAAIGNAGVTLTNDDTGLVLKSNSNGSGVFFFSPIKIGNYRVTASSPGYGTTTLTGLTISMQQQLSVVVTLKRGAASDTTTTVAPLMQTQESSTSQTTGAQSINRVPLSGGNWVFIAQLAAGAAPPQGSHGAGTGDFNSNGQRAEQNNYMLNGVDNNNHLVDFPTGASFVAQPPSEGLAEFKVQSGDYSAEFGHSAGAIINTSLKSGTNSVHGSLWEFVRNTAFDAQRLERDLRACVP